jgi:UDP-N-acetylglucosamine 1-carboxyvinyltransferase
MFVYEIHGGLPLQGEIKVSGSKNAALPILAATLLTDEPVYLGNIPFITDVEDMFECLTALGKNIHRLNNDCLLLPASEPHNIIIPDIASKIRASLLLLGPLMARHAAIQLPQPGGCLIGERPIDLHILALQGFGVDVEKQDSFLTGKRLCARLTAHTIEFPKKTVTGTENAIMAATLADGITTINNAAAEPEIIDLCNFLTQLGASITGAGTDSIQIEGREYLSGCANYAIMPDRIEASTYLVAAATTRGCVKVTNINPSLLTTTLDALQTAGAAISVEHNAVQVDMRKKESKPINLMTAPFPGLPTDIQSTLLSLATTLDGKSAISETIFENRFQMVPELQKMGAQISIEGNTAHISGGSALQAASLEAMDLRSGVALVCAALAAEGTSFIAGIHHIERGYEALVTKLQTLGANISRINLPAPHQPGFFKTPAFPQIPFATSFHLHDL